MGSWKHVDRTGWRREVDRNGGSLAAPMGGIPWHGPSLPNGSKCFPGSWAAPWLGKLGPDWQ